MLENELRVLIIYRDGKGIHTKLTSPTTEKTHTITAGKGTEVLRMDSFFVESELSKEVRMLREKVRHLCGE